MSRAGVDTQLRKLGAAQTVLRQHAAHRETHDTLGVARQEVAEVLGLDAARVTGVAVVQLAFGLAQRNVELAGVDHDHVIADVDVRGEDRLVLATKELRNLGRQASENDAFGVDHVPGVHDVCVFGMVGPHGSTLCVFDPDRFARQADATAQGGRDASREG